MDIFKLVGSVFVDTSKAEESLQKVGDHTEKLSNGFVEGIGKAAKWGAGIAAAAGTAAVALGTQAVKAASDFEDSFAKVNTLLSDTTDLDAYKKSIIDLSNQMGVSTAEISEAVYGTISAGVEASKAVEFTGQALKLAKGGFTDAATAVDVVTTALNSYGTESGLTAEKVSDLLINTQNLGKTTVNELASSMGKVIPTAKTFGVQLDDLCGIYATMTSNGIATAESTTYMNSMLNEMGKSGTKASTALKKATEHIKEGGMSFAEMMEDGWELTDVLSLLDEQASATGVSMMDMFGSAEAGKAATVLWDNAEKLNDAVTAMGESAGTTEEAYTKMHETLSDQMEVFKTNIDNIMIGVGEELMPIVNELLEWVLEHLPEIQEAVGQVVDFIGSAVTSLMPIIQALMPVVKQVFDFIALLWNSSLKPILEGIITFLTGVFTGNWKQAFEGLGKIVKGVFDGLVDIVKVPLNGIIGLVNAVINGINQIKLPSWVPKIGGNGINIPNIPYLAKGGDILEGGSAIVGEAGAELIEMPAGARVTPLTGDNGLHSDEMLAAMTAMLQEMKDMNDNLANNIAVALSGMGIDLDDREVGRLVQKYA